MKKVILILCVLLAILGCQSTQNVIPETASDHDVIIGRWTTVKVNKIRATWDIQKKGKMTGIVRDAGRVSMILYGKWRLEGGYLYTSWQLMEKNDDVFYLEKMARYNHFTNEIKNKIIELDQDKLVIKNKGLEEFVREK